MGRAAGLAALLQRERTGRCVTRVTPRTMQDLSLSERSRRTVAVALMPLRQVRPGLYRMAVGPLLCPKPSTLGAI